MVTIGYLSKKENMTENDQKIVNDYCNNNAMKMAYQNISKADIEEGFELCLNTRSDVMSVNRNDVIDECVSLMREVCRMAMMSKEDRECIITNLESLKDISYNFQKK